MRTGIRQQYQYMIRYSAGEVRVFADLPGLREWAQKNKNIRTFHVYGRVPSTGEYELVKTVRRK